MTLFACDRPRNRPRLRLSLPVLTAISLAPLLLLLPTTFAAQPAWGATLDPPSWSNGVVLCNFQSSVPSVVVSAPQLSDSGLSAGVDELVEVTPAGTIAAVALLGSYNWSAVNISNDNQFALAYSGSVPVQLAAGTATYVGLVSVDVSYLLPAYAASSSGNVSAVAMQVQISDWPWQHAIDSLTLTLSLAPAFPDTEHLVASPSPGSVIGSVSNQSGRALEYFAIGTEAVATSSIGVTAPIGVVPQITLHPASGTVELLFGAGAGDFQSVNYTAHLGIVLPATIAGIPLYEFVLVGAFAGLVALGVGTVARRIRQGPSDLIYVEEEP